MKGKPMKIGIVCYPTVGGSGVVATEIAIQSALAGHEVHVLSYDRPARLQHAVPGLRYHNVQVSAYPLFRYPPYDLALATRMLEVHEEARLDLFHVHYAIPHAISAFLANAMGHQDMRWVTTLHGTDITVVGADRTYTRPTRFAIEQSHAVTAVSRYLAEETMMVFGCEGIEVIPNFVDTERFRPGSEGRWYDRGDEERRIVHASNLRPIKRVADVVRAFARIADAVPARLVVAGDGPDREHALAVATDLGVAEQVEAVGNRGQDELADLFADADLFLSASETESFGLSMLEAMSCGVPCVSTDVGGVSEVFGETGRLVPFADVTAMADAAIALLRDEAEHRTQSAAVRQRAVECFAQEIVLERYDALYHRVASS